MGLFSSSKSSSTTNNNYEANPLTVDEGLGVFARGDASVTSITNITDGGIVSRALSSIDQAGALQGAGFTQLLDSAGSMFDRGASLNSDFLGAVSDLGNQFFQRGESLIGQTQSAVADAYGQATADRTGAIDQRTMIVLALAAVAGLFLLRRGR